jgi:4-alpha-glucanotransferase
MPSDTFEQLLGRACALNGIDPGFWDIWGKYHETTLAAKQAILRAKGFDATDAASLKQSLADHDRAEWERILPPALVVGESEPIELAVSVRADALGERIHLQVRAEDGNFAAFELKLWELPAAASVDMEGGTRVRKLARLPVELPLGYHEVKATVRGETSVCRIAVTPSRAFTPEYLG